MHTTQFQMRRTEQPVVTFTIKKEESYRTTRYADLTETTFTGALE